MARGKEPKSGVLPQRELFERMNFLYQSSQFFASLGGCNNTENQPIARFYTKEMRSIARKSVLRLSPHIKREMCRLCSSPLLPGVSCTTRVKKKRGNARVVTTCTYCGGQTKLLANPDHVLFVDKPEHKTIH